MFKSFNNYLNRIRYKLIKFLKEITDKNTSLFLRILKSVSNLKSEIKIDEKLSTLSGIKQAVKEINLIKSGKSEAKDARELIEEL